MNRYWTIILIIVLSYSNSLRAEIVLQPAVTYVFFSGTAKIYPSMEELMENFNAAADISFNQCVAGGQSHCSKPIMKSYVARDSSMENNLPTYYKIIYSAYSRKIDIDGNVTTYEVDPHHFYGAAVSHDCPQNTRRISSGASGNLTIECVLIEPLTCPSAGNPISISTGIKKEKFIDFQTNDGLLNVERTYISQYDGWESSNAPSLYPVAANSSVDVDLNKPFKAYHYGLDPSHPYTDTVYHFNVSFPVKNKNNSNEIYYSSHGKIHKFISAGNNSFFSISPEKNGVVIMPAIVPQNINIKWKFIDSDGDLYYYTESGLLAMVQYKGGGKISYVYEQNRLAKKTDHLGRSVEYLYDGNGNLKSVITPAGKEIRYFYIQISEVTWVISRVVFPDSTERIYHYEDTRFPIALTGITDERGKRYATWAYDAQGRAISSEHAGGAEKTLLTFNSSVYTTVTNALNKQTIYRFDDIAGARRVTKVEGQPTANCVGANQDYTYTNEGWIASKTDWKGIKTTYQYNTLGQETSRTEAFGTSEARTITTEWHPTLFVKTKVTEPEKETTYSYDANGRLLNQSTQSISVQ